MAEAHARGPDQRERTLLGRLGGTLPQLDALLRAEGFAVGPDRWQNVYDLLLALQERGRMPARAAALQPLLAPLFCRDANEQARFALTFRRWVDGLAPEPAAVAEGPAPRPRPPPKPLPPPRPPLRWLILGLLLGALVLAATTYGVVRYLADPEPPPPEIVPRTTQPDAASGTPVRSDASLQPRPLPPRAPPESLSLNPANRARLETAGLLAPLLPAFLLFGYLGARWLNWNLVLRRRRGREGMPLHAITLDADQDDLFTTPALREALKRLHAPVLVPTRRLDAAATVRATACSGGLFRPVWQQRRRVPDCVVLLDHTHGADHMAGLGLQAVERLRQAGLEVARYDYRRDPRRLMGEDGRWHGLAQVAARHEGARLLVIGEAASLINPLSGTLYGWTDALELWPQRGLLGTRRPPTAWRAALAARQFRVADLGSAGLLQVVAWFSPVPLEPTAAPAESLRLLPRLLQDDARWLQPMAPPQAEREALLRTLRDYLGADGWLLLAAMAAYPQLHWGLTHALDLGLFREQTAAQRERRLLSVARLPWCRAGNVPDWLREALRDELAPTEIERVARLYQWLMREAEVNGRGAIRLPVSLPESGRFWRGLRRWLRASGQVADRYDPRNDRVFAEILLGRRARRLDFRLPRPLARRLGPRLNALLPRLVLAGLLAAVAGGVVRLGWNGWGQTPAEAWLLARQLQSHSTITVDIWHTEATEGYAQALVRTLRAARFEVVVEPHELAMAARPEQQAQVAADHIVHVQPVNAVQWGVADLGDAAGFVADRLAYLAWGGVPNQVGPGAELPLTGSGLDRPPAPAHVRALLLTPARDRTGFGFRDPLQATVPATESGVFRDPLQGGGQGEMIALPGGTFQMGSPSGEPERSANEGPRHQVRIRPFAIGKTEVTFADYDAFAAATGRKKPYDFGWGRGQRPVINVSWNDATAYAAWLSEQTGQRYRLPTEAEWEYAARAGADTPFWTGDCIHTDRANYNGNYDYNNCGAKTGVYRGRTVEAGSLPANAWGLHETAGNVWEWVRDCWHDNYQGAPTDGNAWEESGCARRVVRGGGWNNSPRGVRSAYRGRDTPDGASDSLGFRLARD